MHDRELSERLRELPVGDQADAEARASALVAAAFRSRAPTPRRATRLRVVLASAAVALAIAIGAVTSPGDAVADWLRDVLELGRRDARPALVSLPAPGRLLVTNAQGAWIVQRDGSKRLLGAYDQATWSPRGLFAAVSRGRELTAVDPRGRVRWSLARARPIADARWSPDGFRIAYRSGGALRLVRGDGAEDHLLRATVAPIASAWRPGAGHVLAFAARGRAVVADADSGRRLWSVRAGGGVVGLHWSPSGSLLVRTATTVRSYAGSGRLVAEVGVPVGGAVLAAALSPDGRTLAIARRARTGGAGEVLALRLSPAATRPRTMFRGAGTFSDLAWSPDGRWLLIAWRDADQWLFVRSASVRRLVAVSHIARAFAPGHSAPQRFPALAGWCCPADR